MKGISFNRSNRKYEAYLYIGKTKISLGSFHKKDKAADRLKTAQEAVDGGQDIREWLASNPNKKTFSCAQEAFDEEYNAFLEEDAEPITKDGYHKKLNFHFTNMKRLQIKYEDELKGKTHVAKKVHYLDSSPDLFVKKLINFRYWKLHLAEIGKQITYNNLYITKFELKLALIKVFQRNIYLPQKLQPSSNIYSEEWKKIEQEFDEIVQECIYGIPKRKPIVKTKIIYNPELNLSKEERQEIVTNHTSAKKKKGTLEKLLKYYEEGMSRRKLHKKSGVSRPTISRHWENLQKQVA